MTHLDTARPAPEPIVASLAVSAEQVVKQQIVPTSVRAWRRADSAGKIPHAIRFGQKKLWRVADLQLWVELGCPDRAAFERELEARD